jgi:hypothetical protein
MNRALKGRPKMQPSPLYASNPLPHSCVDNHADRHTEDRVYQAVTVAAMLLLLGSVWIF